MISCTSRAEDESLAHQTASGYHELSVDGVPVRVHRAPNEVAPGECAMRRSLRALLEGVIDYAGLFPPAKLPMEQAIRNYARYRREQEGWMLGRFLCPASRLAELAPF